MQRKESRIRLAAEGTIMAALVGGGIWYMASRCGTADAGDCIFSGASDLWAGLAQTGVMLVAGALLAATLSRVDGALGLNGQCAPRERDEAGE